MAMKLRLAHKGDFKEIYQLWNNASLSVKKYDLEKYDFEQILALNSSSCFVGLINNTIVATIFGTFNGRRAWIYHIAVHPAHQKKGYGSDLLSKVEQALKSRGAKKIILGVAFENADVLPFYKKNGYQIMNDAILMAKEI